MRVKDLILQLQQLHPDLQIYSEGADSGGYDACYYNGIIVKVINGRLLLSGNSDSSSFESYTDKDLEHLDHAKVTK